MDSFRAKGQVIHLGRTWVKAISFLEAVGEIERLVDMGHPALVLTLNVAQVWQSTRSSVLAMAYSRADLSVPDGWPILAAFKLLRVRGACGRVTGADLMPRLCSDARSVALIGGRGDSAREAAKALSTQNPSLVVRRFEPAPRHELVDEEGRAAMISRVSAADVDYVFVGLGVPKQEAFALELLPHMKRGVVLCVGAAVDFSAGRVKRSPLWMQSAGLEWLWRVGREPRRLGGRYIVSSIYFIGLLCAGVLARISGRI